HSMVIVSRGIKILNPKTARVRPPSLFLLFCRLFLWLVFLFDFDCACAINGPKLAEAALPKGPFPLQLRLGLDGKARPGNRRQTSFRNRFAGQLALAVSILLNAFERLFDFVDRILVGRKEAQGEI